MRKITNDTTDRYRKAAATLALHGIDTSVSEADGIVCGLMIARGRYAGENSPTSALDSESYSHLTEWLAIIAGDTHDMNAATLSEPLADLLIDIYEQLSRGLISDDYELHLLLPDDTAPLPERCQAIIGWCQGLVLGFLHGRHVDIQALPNDVPEIVSDIIAIAESGIDQDIADSDDEEEDDDSERALVEIEEYVKVGVRLMFEELVIGATAASTERAPASESLH